MIRKEPLQGEWGVLRAHLVRACQCFEDALQAMEPHEARRHLLALREAQKGAESSAEGVKSELESRGERE